jgi:uncharacterized membrane protein HdeD (DUF308 family)
VRKAAGLRALISLPVGLFITFFQDHSAQVGLLSLLVAAAALAVGILSLALGSKELRNHLPIAVAGVVVAVAASVALTRSETSQLALFSITVAGFGLVIGAFELYLASRFGFGARVGRDLLISAVLLIALGVLFVAAGLDEVSAVGFFGAFLILYGVHWGIAATTEEKK